MIRVRIKKQLHEISKREQELKDKLLDPDLVGIPREMKRLAAGIMEEEELTEKGQKKPQCTVGNARHSSDGRFGSKDNNTSWSLSKPSGATNCTAGQSRMDKGSNKRKITRKDKRTKRCGRDKATGTSKSRYRCKDGSKVWEEGDTEPRPIKVRIRKTQDEKSMILAAPPQWINEELRSKETATDQGIDPAMDQTTDPVIDQEKISDLDQAMTQRDKLINALAKLSAKERLEVLKDPCNMTGLYSIDKAAQMVNKYSLALKGKMNDDPKK